MRGWLNAVKDEHFDQKMQHLCKLYQQAPALEAAGEVVFTSDEMTGVQALGVVAPTTLKRLHPDEPMRKGEPAKREFEYIRHSTISLTIHYDQEDALKPMVGWRD